MTFLSKISKIYKICNMVIIELAKFKAIEKMKNRYIP